MQWQLFSKIITQNYRAHMFDFFHGLANDCIPSRASTFKVSAPHTRTWPRHMQPSISRNRVELRAGCMPVTSRRGCKAAQRAWSGLRILKVQTTTSPQSLAPEQKGESIRIALHHISDERVGKNLSGGTDGTVEA